MHPLHPLCGRDFEFVACRQNWGEDRVHLHDENGQLFSLPAGWTDATVADPFVVIAAGRCPFTTDGWPAKEQRRQRTTAAQPLKPPRAGRGVPRVQISNARTTARQRPAQPGSPRDGASAANFHALAASPRGTDDSFVRPPVQPQAGHPQHRVRDPPVRPARQGGRAGLGRQPDHRDRHRPGPVRRLRRRPGRVPAAGRRGVPGPSRDRARPGMLAAGPQQRVVPISEQGVLFRVRIYAA